MVVNVEICLRSEILYLELDFSLSVTGSERELRVNAA